LLRAIAPIPLKSLKFLEFPPADLPKRFPAILREQRATPRTCFTKRGINTLIRGINPASEEYTRDRFAHGAAKCWIIVPLERAPSLPAPRRYPQLCTRCARFDYSRYVPASINRLAPSIAPLARAVYEPLSSPASSSLTIPGADCGGRQQRNKCKCRYRRRSCVGFSIRG